MESNCGHKPLLRVKDFGSIFNFEPPPSLPNNSPSVNSQYKLGLKTAAQKLNLEENQNSSSTVAPTANRNLTVTHKTTPLRDSSVDNNNSTVHDSPVGIFEEPSDHQYYIATNATDNKLHLSTRADENLKYTIKKNFRRSTSIPCYENKKKSLFNNIPNEGSKLPIIKNVTSYSPLYNPRTYDQWETQMRNQILSGNPLINYPTHKKRKKRVKIIDKIDKKLKLACYVSIARIDESKLIDGRLLDVNTPFLKKTKKEDVNVSKNVEHLSKGIIEIKPRQSVAIPVLTPNIQNDHLRGLKLNSSHNPSNTSQNSNSSPSIATTSSPSITANSSPSITTNSSPSITTNSSLLNSVRTLTSFVMPNPSASSANKMEISDNSFISTDFIQPVMPIQNWSSPSLSPKSLLKPTIPKVTDLTSKTPLVVVASNSSRITLQNSIPVSCHSETTRKLLPGDQQKILFGPRTQVPFFNKTKRTTSVLRPTIPTTIVPGSPCNRFPNPIMPSPSINTSNNPQQTIVCSSEVANNNILNMPLCQSVPNNTIPPVRANFNPQENHPDTAFEGFSIQTIDSGHLNLQVLGNTCQKPMMASPTPNPLYSMVRPHIKFANIAPSSTQIVTPTQKVLPIISKNPTSPIVATNKIKLDLVTQDSSNTTTAATFSNQTLKAYHRKVDNTPTNISLVKSGSNIIKNNLESSIKILDVCHVESVSKAKSEKDCLVAFNENNESLKSNKPTLSMPIKKIYKNNTKNKLCNENHFDKLSAKFKKKKRILCSKCKIVVPTSFFWIHVLSQELLCKNCVIQGEKPELPFNGMDDLLECIYKATSDLNSSDDETDELLEQVNEILETGDKISLHYDKLKRKKKN